MFGATHLIGFAAGGGGGFSLTYLSGQSDTVDRTTYTFSGLTLGTGKIVVCVGGASASGNSQASVTVGGSAATLIKRQQADTTNFATEIHQYHANTAASGDVVVTWNHGMVSCQITVYLLTGAADAASDTDGANATASPSVNLDCPAGGAIIAACYAVDGTSATWTNLTENRDNAAENRLMTSASSTFAAAQTGLAITCAASGGSPTETSFAAASWAPA